MVEHEPTSWIDRVAIVISRVSMLMVAVIVVIIFYEVIMRYLFQRPTMWVNEMSLWLGGLIYLFSGMYVMQQRAHIRIFILYDLCPRWLQRVFDVLSTIFICLFAFAVVYGGSIEAWQKLMRWETFGTAWDPPIPATMKPLVLLVVVLIAIQAVANLVADWNREKEVHDPADEIL
jgi:TRAP-type C4-dicarboxylate transport system permease small subunit